jgi:hypothetical protein
LATEAAITIRDHARKASAVDRLVAVIAIDDSPSQWIARRAGLGVERTLDRDGARVAIYATAEDV